MHRRRFSLVAGLGALIAAGALIPPVRRLFHPFIVRLNGGQSVRQRVEEFAAARARVREQCGRAGVPYPPARVVLLGLKDERLLDVYAGASEATLVRIASHPIRAASGGPGPKLREGDRQVPEGVYAIESLNPNSRFHVALRVGYPNTFDKQMAANDGRADLGGDIMIHGNSVSVGCLAMGDRVAEDLFVLAAESGIENVRVVLSPVDLRKRELPPGLGEGWRRELYGTLRDEIGKLPAS